MASNVASERLSLSEATVALDAVSTSSVSLKEVVPLSDELCVNTPSSTYIWPGGAGGRDDAARHVIPRRASVSATAIEVGKRRDMGGTYRTGFLEDLWRPVNAFLKNGGNFLEFSPIFGLQPAQCPSSDGGNLLEKPPTSPQYSRL